MMLTDGAELSTLQAVFENCEIDARSAHWKQTAFMIAGCRDDLN